jgi:hypothetical protein
MNTIWWELRRSRCISTKMSFTTLILIGHHREIAFDASCGRKGWLCSQKVDITDKRLDHEQFVTFSLHSTPVSFPHIEPFWQWSPSPTLFVIQFSPWCAWNARRQCWWLSARPHISFRSTAGRIGTDIMPLDWRLPRAPTQFPVISTNNISDARTCEVGVTLAPFDRGSLDGA